MVKHLYLIKEWIVIAKGISIHIVLFIYIIPFSSNGDTADVAAFSRLCAVVQSSRFYFIYISLHNSQFVQGGFKFKMHQISTFKCSLLSLRQFSWTLLADASKVQNRPVFNRRRHQDCHQYRRPTFR